MKKIILGASIGNCVHVAGILNFFKLAEEYGYKAKFLGPAVSVEYMIEKIKEEKPEMVAISYRLTSETGYKILKRLEKAVKEEDLTNYRFVFGGTKPVAEKAQKIELFEKVFTGEEEVEEIIAFLEGRNLELEVINYSNNLLERLDNKKPYPLIRHHFGLPDVEETVKGIEKIAESKVLDIISLGPDQNAQESFFRPEEMDQAETGAGGVPIRTVGDLQNIYQASRRGNFPLMRSYSGTRDVFKMAKMLLENLNNAWCAVPLSWYNQLDGRGPRTLLESICENQKLMKWHGDRGIPVEVNEAHHWSLRDAHDTIAVVMAYLAAYNAKKMGVNTYIAQYMFNTPTGTSAQMDIAKMLAKKELIEELVDKEFRVLTQVRAGLSSFPVNLNKAKGQLAYSTFLSMSLNPDIIHVVAFSEADHAAKSGDIIESCQIARQVINNLIYTCPQFTADQDIRNRKEELIKEAKILLKSIKDLIHQNNMDPLSDPFTIAKAIQIGLIDAPHLQGNQFAAGKLRTKLINGACYAYDYKSEKIISEEERISKIFKEEKVWAV